MEINNSDQMNNTVVDHNDHSTVTATNKESLESFKSPIDNKDIKNDNSTSNAKIIKRKISKKYLVEINPSQIEEKRKSHLSQQKVDYIIQNNNNNKQTIVNLIVFTNNQINAERSASSSSSRTLNETKNNSKLLYILYIFILFYFLFFFIFFFLNDN